MSKKSQKNYVFNMWKLTTENISLINGWMNDRWNEGYRLSSEFVSEDKFVVIMRRISATCIKQLKIGPKRYKVDWRVNNDAGLTADVEEL